MQVTLASKADVTSRDSSRSRVRVDRCVSAVRAVEVPVLVCLRSSCSHVTEVGDPKVCEAQRRIFFPRKMTGTLWM